MSSNLISPHGGYRKLKSYQNSEIVFDLTVEFCESYLASKTNRTYRSRRTYDQMIQAARSGKQNIAEGSKGSGTSKQTELRLVDVSRASLEELLLDYEDFLRANKISQWPKDDSRSIEIRKLAYSPNRTYKTYLSYFKNSEMAANCLICLINQTNYLLDRQMIILEKDLKQRGDFKDRYRNVKKKEILGCNENYEGFLNQFGMKRLEDGRVVEDK